MQSRGLGYTIRQWYTCCKVTVLSWFEGSRFLKRGCHSGNGVEDIQGF